MFQDNDNKTRPKNNLKTSFQFQELTSILDNRWEHASVEAQCEVCSLTELRKGTSF